MNIEPLSAIAGVSIEGIDLSQRRSASEDHTLRQLFDEHGLLVFRNQHLTKQQLVEAGQPFGGTRMHAVTPDPEVPAVTVISTRASDGSLVPHSETLVGDLEWHSDQGFLPAPCRGKYLYAIEVPEVGGMTGFINGGSTYAALSEAMKTRLRGLHVVQSWAKAESHIARNRDYRADGHRNLTKDLYPDVVYPIVYRHPIDDTLILNVPPMWASAIPEMPGPAGCALIDELIAHVLRPEFQYWHRYQVGDALVWDNWRFIHAASGTPGGQARTLWSIMLNGGPEIGRPYQRQAA